MSFIGLDRILDHVVELIRPSGRLVALVKPQFEAGRAEADRGRGVIRDPAVWKQVLVDAADAAGRRGFVVAGVVVSPIKGAAGNVEFFLDLAGPDSSRAAQTDGAARADRADLGADAAAESIQAAVQAATQLP